MDKNKKVIEINGIKEEMVEHCEKYPCSTCTIAHRCSLFGKLFGYLPKTPNKSLEMDGQKTARHSA